MKQRTLMQRLLPAFIFAAVIPVTIFSLIFQGRLRASIDDGTKKQIDINLEKSNQCLDMVLDKYNTILYDLCTDDDIVNLVEEINHSRNDLEANTSILRRELNHVCNRNTGIVGITLVTKEGEVVFYDKLTSSSVTTEWADVVQVPEIIQGTVYQTLEGPLHTESGQRGIFQVARRVIDYYDIHKELATVILSIDESVLRGAIRVDDKTDVFLGYEESVFSALDLEELGQPVTQLKKPDYKIYSTVNEKTGWTIYHQYSALEYRNAVMEQIYFVFLLTVWVMVLVFVIIYFSTRPVVQTINDLAKAMKRVAAGDFTVRLPEDSKKAAEVYQISVSFNETVVQTEQLIQQVKQAVLEQKNAEISALEAQIDPHFLYNTLDTINWKAIDKEEYEISEMLGALANILRYSVKNAGEETTIEREIGWLEEYILLQSSRLGREVILEKEMQPDILGCMIHKLLLQPFVENAIKYGFRREQESCVIKLSIRRVENQLHIVVEDNGKGMSEERIKQLNQGSINDVKHVGIMNVKKRLELYYGEEAVLYFESLRGSFTKVHLFIPINAVDM